MTKTAISRNLGNISVLEDQLDIGRITVAQELWERKLIVTSGDLICDLISGDARLTIRYPVMGANRSISVAYAPLIVKIPNR